MGRKIIKAKASKKVGKPVNEHEVVVDITDATKLALSLSNVGMRLRELESQMHNYATNELKLLERVNELELRVTELETPTAVAFDEERAVPDTTN